MFVGPAQSSILPVLAALTGAVCPSFLMIRAAAYVAGATKYPLYYATALSIWLWSNAAVDLFISTALSLTLRARIACFNPKTDWLL
ncbi:hypothetical protein JCM11641_000134 [Rhodosporidiobolus odoratus]